VTDNFALLNEPRRPWLDADLLKQKFLTLSANLHPDRIHSAGKTEKAEATKKFTELNAAFNCLAEPKSRLLHLIELELGSKPKDIHSIPAGLADLFAEIAGVCRSADQFLAEKSRAASPLLKVQYFGQQQEWVERLTFQRNGLAGIRSRMEEELKIVDGIWLAGDTITQREQMPKLEELYRLFGYFNRWSSQLQERIVQLSF
jgi:curved DNA-binding protein CbpA